MSSSLVYSFHDYRMSIWYLHTVRVWIREIFGYVRYIDFFIIKQVLFVVSDKLPYIMYLLHMIFWDIINFVQKHTLSPVIRLLFFINFACCFKVIWL